jgi:hypothetical protein
VRPRFFSLSALLASAALASCLADIPELTGATSATGSGGATVASTAATTWCDGRDPSIEFCADFDEVADAAEGWGGHAHVGNFGTVELATEPHVSPPRSMHAWVEGAGGAGGGPDCERAGVRKDFINVQSETVEAALSVRRIASWGIVADFEWDRGTSECEILVRYLDHEIHLSLFALGGDDINTGLSFDHTITPTDGWHRLEVAWHRGNETPLFDVVLDDKALHLKAPDTFANVTDWWTRCSTDHIPDALTFSIGSFCIGPDFATDAYFDNVTLDFR